MFFVVLLNLLDLNPWVLPFAHFSFPSHWGDGDGWATSCLVLGCWLLSSPMTGWKRPLKVIPPAMSRDIFS